MITYALDTNTLSYFLRDEGNVRKNMEQEIFRSGNAYAIPPITIYEVQRWLRDKPTQNMKIASQQFETLLYAVKGKSEISLDIWEKAADIYISLKQKGQLIGDADILIAAYCLINNYTLVTHNTNDFVRIERLKIVSWY